MEAILILLSIDAYVQAVSDESDRIRQACSGSIITAMSPYKHVSELVQKIGARSARFAPRSIYNKLLQFLAISNMFIKLMGTYMISHRFELVVS